MESSFSWIRNRQTGVLNVSNPSSLFKDTAYLTKRLTQTGVLTGHNGCVNTVSWSTDGSRILSGSDDCHLNVYDPLKRQLLVSVHSSHRSNIFSAKFLSSTADYKCVSCAGLGSVEFSEFTPSGDYLPHTFSCQSSITYQVATTPHDPNEFFTCEEKGLVRLFDLRIKSSCHCNGCHQDVLYSFPCGVTSLSVHPICPFYVAMGLGDGTTCLMDRRMTGSPVYKVTPDQLAQRACCRRYRAVTAHSKPFKITCVQFNEYGSELLTSYSEDYLYLFNSQLFGCGSGTASRVFREPKQSYCFSNYRNKKRSSGSRGKDCKPTAPANTPITEDETTEENTPRPNEEATPPIKRLRLRGDWSDTGPEARPEAEAPVPRNTFMNRMSRMFARWIDETLTSPSREGEEQNEEQEEEEERLSSGVDDNEESFEDSFESYSDSGGSRASPTSFLTSAMASCSTSTPSKREGDGDVELKQDEPNPPQTGEGSKVEMKEPKESFVFSLEDNLTGDSESDQCKKSSPVAASIVSPRTDGLISSNSDPSTAQDPSDWQEDDCTMKRMSSDCKKTISPRSLSPLPDRLTEGERTSDLSDGQLCRTALERDNNDEAKTFREGNGHTDPGYLPDYYSSTEELPASGHDAHVTLASTNGHSLDMCPSEDMVGRPYHQPHSLRTSSPTEEHASGSLGDGVYHGRALIPSLNIIEGETDSDDVEETDEFLEGEPHREEFVSECQCVEIKDHVMLYKGHRNARTMIKQANFWGDQYVMSGSDCGRVFVWDKWSGEVVNLLVGDSHVVNCVQPHPSACVLATSGIDYDIKLWEPSSLEECQLEGLSEIIERNEVMLQESRNTVTVPSSFILQVLAYLNRRRRMRNQDREEEPQAD